MAVFMLNICKFNSCGLTFGTLGHLIQHIEETHIDNDPQVLERQERAQPACVPLSYVLRFLTDAARRENALTAVAAQQASKAVSASSLSSSSASSCLSSASYVASGSLSNSQQLQQPQTQHLLLQQQLQQPSQLHAQQQQQQPPQRMVKTLVPASGISNATAGASDDDEDDADNNEDDDDDDEDDEDIIDCDDDDDDDEEDDEVEDCASNDSWFTTRTNFEHGVEQRQHLQQQHNGHAASSMRYNPVVARNNYQYQQHLQQHQTTKDDSKPFACPVPGCKKRYKNVNGIKYHTKNGHKNDKLLTANFQHQKLQQHLINKASLARNVSNVSSHFHSNANNNSTNKSFKCGCGKSYKTPYGLKNHMAVRHNIVQDHNKSSYHYSQTLVTNNTIPSAIQDHGYIKQQEPQGLECDANLGVLTPAPSPGSLNHHIKYSEMAS